MPMVDRKITTHVTRTACFCIDGPSQQGSNQVNEESERERSIQA
jgi:hypothetical protein